MIKEQHGFGSGLNSCYEPAKRAQRPGKMKHSCPAEKVSGVDKDVRLQAYSDSDSLHPEQRNNDDAERC